VLHSKYNLERSAQCALATAVKTTTYATRFQVFDKAWVSEDGSWGTNAIVMFDPSTITDEQLEILDNLNDSDKYDYIIAIFNGDDLR